MKRRCLALAAAAALALVVVPSLALAARSGASFGGRGGFRSGSSFPRSYSTGRRAYGGGGPNVILLPGFGWGWGGGYGAGAGGGFGLLGGLVMIGVLGLGAVLVMRAVRRGRGLPSEIEWDEERGAPLLDRAYVYKVQLGLGRSARAIQNRLEKFAAEGDTVTEAGLAHLLHQTTLELMRERHSIRYGAADAAGPMSLTNGETKMNAHALSERSRFTVERVRGADGKVRRSDIAATESAEALEYLVVTLVIASRAPLAPVGELSDREQLDAVLGALGGVAPQALLGLEVIWTPADPEDSLTQADLLTTYPNLRSL